MLSNVKNEPGWWKKFEFFDGGGGILMAFRQSVDIVGLEKYTKEIERYTKKQAVYALINIIPPGIKSEIHTDTLKFDVFRYHLPLQTNPGAWWWDETGGRRVLEAGVWHGPMPYKINHAVGNDGVTDRVHLVIDLI